MNLLIQVALPVSLILQLNQLSDTEARVSRPRRMIVISLRDTDDQPVSGAMGGVFFQQPLETDQYRVFHRFTDDTPRRLVFWHPDRDIGAFIEVSRNTPNLHSLVLRPLGSVTGVVLNERKQPMRNQGITFHTRGHTVTCKSDENGKFAANGLVPGVTYQPSIDGGHANANPFSMISVESGQTRDIGTAVRKTPLGKPYLGLGPKSREGPFIVEWVAPSSPASDAGIERGDI